MRNFHKFGKANISVAEMEKERERLRKKMNATQNSMKTDTKKPKKAYKPSDFKLGESVKVLSMNLTGSVTSLPDSKGNVTVQMGILRSTVNISDLEIIDEAPAYSFAKRTRQTDKGKVKNGQIILRSVLRSTFLVKQSMKRSPSWINIWTTPRLHTSVL